MAGEHHDPETVLGLESHPLMLDAVVAHLSAAGFKVAAGTRDHHAVVRLVEREQPALLIVGVDQVDPGEQQLFAQLRAVRPGLKIIVYGTDVARAVDRSVRAGADAFVRKSAPVEDLVVALRQMTHRTIYFRDLLAEAVGDAESSISTTSVLTDREYEVIRLAASGLPRKAIAESLGLSIATVGELLDRGVDAVEVVRLLVATGIWSEAGAVEIVSTFAKRPAEGEQDAVQGVLGWPGPNEDPPPLFAG